MIEIHVLAKLGKRFCIDHTCFNVVDDLHDYCKVIFRGNRSSPRAQTLSMNYRTRSNSIMSFLLYLCNKFIFRAKYCQTTINADSHQFYSKYTIIAINVETILYTSALRVVFRGLQNSISLFDVN